MVSRYKTGKRQEGFGSRFIYRVVVCRVMQVSKWPGGLQRPYLGTLL